MANDVLVEFGAKIDALNTGVEQVKAKLGEISSHTEGLNSSFGALGQRIVEVFSVTAIVAFILKMGELGEQTERTMAQLGMSASEVLNLGGIAKVVGTSMEGLTTSIERMSLNVQRSTADAVNPQAEALRVLGLRAKDLIGIPTAEYIEKLHDAVSKFNPSLNLTNAVMAVGGRGVAQMIPLLQMSGEEWVHLRERIVQANGQLASTVPTLNQVDDEIDFLSLAVRSAAAEMFSSLAPAVIGVTRALYDFAINVREAVREGGALSGTFEVIAFTARLVATAIAAAISALLGLGVAVEGLAKLALGAIEDFEKNAAKTAEAIEKIGRDLKAQLDAIWGAPRPVVIPPPRQDASALNQGLSKAMSDRLAIIQNEYRLESDIINQQFGKFWFSEGSKTDALLAALQKRFDAEVAAGEKTTLAYSKFALDRQKILDAANKVYEQSINNVFGGIQSAFNSQLRGMLAGTVTFGKAVRAMLGDMIIWAIQEIEKLAFQWVAHELIKTAATETGTAARAAAETAGEAASLPTKIAKFTSDIMADAALVFGGIFANLAPFLGPAAAAPAAAGQASVLAEMVNVPKFAVGTDYVARTGLAFIHQGERIMPAQGTGPYTTGPNATNVTLNISAVDARSFANLINSNPDVFTKLIRRSMRDFKLNLAPGR